MRKPRRSTDPPRAPLTSDPAAKRLTPREREIALLVAWVAARLDPTAPEPRLRRG